MSIKPETLAWLRQTATADGATYSEALLGLLERVEVLEQRPIPGTVELTTPTPEPAPVVTDEQILAMRSWSSHGHTFDSDLVEFGRNCYHLGRQHGAAQRPAAEPAADRVLVNYPETCWIEIRRIADGKIIYSNHRKGELVIPVGEPPAAPSAPAGGLVERVVKVIADPDGPAELWCDDARAAIREVASWLDERGMHGCSLWLREEIDRA
jgi:hypothetical protein